MHSHQAGAAPDYTQVPDGAEVQELDLPGGVRVALTQTRDVVTIYEFSSRNPGDGHARRALAQLRLRVDGDRVWPRAKSLRHIEVIDPGEPGSNSRRFWQKMAREGLVHRFYDDAHQPIVHPLLCCPEGYARTFLHGTNAPIERFDPAMVGARHNTPDNEGEMYFFTDDERAAHWYARSAAEGGGEPRLVHAHLLLTNPLVSDFQGEGIEHLFVEIGGARRAGHDGLITLNYDDGGAIDQYVVFDSRKIQILACPTLKELLRVRRAATLAANERSSPCSPVHGGGGA